MIHDPTSSELNNNLGFGIALDLGLGSLHEFFFSCREVFDRTPRIPPTLAPMGRQ